jgi:hypothetical protein
MKAPAAIAHRPGRWRRCGRENRENFLGIFELGRFAILAPVPSDVRWWGGRMVMARDLETRGRRTHRRSADRAVQPCRGESASCSSNWVRGLSLHGCRQAMTCAAMPGENHRLCDSGHCRRAERFGNGRAADEPSDPADRACAACRCNKLQTRRLGDSRVSFRAAKGPNRERKWG